MTCDELLKTAISKNSSAFHRLVYLAGTLDSTSGQYHEPMLSLAYCDDEVHLVLLREHAAAFRAWICLGLEEQAEDLAGYLENAANRDAREMLKEWITTRWFETLIPKGASEPDQILFRGDMEIILPLLYSVTTIRCPHERRSKKIDFARIVPAYNGR